MTTMQKHFDIMARHTAFCMATICCLRIPTFLCPHQDWCWEANNASLPPSYIAQNDKDLGGLRLIHLLDSKQPISNWHDGQTLSSCASLAIEDSDKYGHRPQISSHSADRFRHCSQQMVCHPNDVTSNNHRTTRFFFSTGSVTRRSAIVKISGLPVGHGNGEFG